MPFPPAGPDVEQPELTPVHRDDPKIAAPKIAAFQYFAVAIFLFLISGFWGLQVQNEDYYSARAERNRIKAIPILAPRGKILDRDGRVIVDNHSSFSLILSREALKQENLKPIADGLRLDYDDLVKRLERFRNRPKYEPLVLKEEMTPADLSFVDSHRDFFPELEVIPAQRRLYPQNGFAAHVLGYTGEISEAELDMASFAQYNPGDVIGKFGVERQYNETLMGVDGQRQVMVDNRGQPREVLSLKEAVPGRDIQLTLDLDLQVVAELAMEGKKGAVVALDPRSGEVLAMVSRPTFDPNKFAVRIKSSDWREIADNPDNPLLNRVIQAQLAPGSTFKPIMQLAGLESGEIDPKWSVRCGGGASFYGRYFKCWQKRGHGGGVDAIRGMAHSCDVYFYTLGNKIGIDKIAYYAEQAGLGERAGIDLPHEVGGVVPSQQWVMRNFRRKWYAGETISVSIGQGALTVTPLQLVRAIGGLAVGGVWHHPHLLKDLSKTEKPHVLKVNPENVQTVIDGMHQVVQIGTGVRARLPGVEVCGKTGTAQLASNQYLSGKSARHLRDNAWFVAFAPRQAPEIVVVALWENGEHGNLAAPIVRDVMKAYFDKKARLAGQSGKPAGAAQPETVEMQGPAVEEQMETAPEAPAEPPASQPEVRPQP